MKRIKQRDLLKDLQAADCYEAWATAAAALDELSGEARWKREEQTRIYDYAAIRNRLEQLQSFRRAGDDHGLLFALNEGIHGNMGNMGRAELYQRARFGTKQLVTDYVEELCVSLQHLSDAELDAVSADDRLDFFRRASLCFGRSALLLSGGGIFGYFHIGVLQTLIEQDLLPRVISGASAGSLMAGIVGTHRRAELPAIFDPRHLQIQTKREPRARGNFAGLFPRFDIGAIRRHIERLIPDLTFAEAHRLTGICINVSVSPAELHQTPRLLNAITSPDVYVRSAVLASCAVPGIYPPVPLMAKNRYGLPQPYLPDRRWVDGSLSDDVPARRLSRLYGVNHYIVSQVNPFALIQPQVQPASSVLQDAHQFWFHSAKNAARVLHRATDKYGRRWPDFRYAVNSMMSVWMQDYSGDINILPPPGMVKPWKGMSQPSADELAAIIHAGEQSIWPKVERIRNCTKIGRTLDDILARLDASNPVVAQRAPLTTVAATTAATTAAIPASGSGRIQ